MIKGCKIVDTFFKCFPEFKDMVVDYEVISNYECVVTFSNGSKMLFDGFYECLRMIDKGKTNDNDILPPEDEWRDGFSLRLRNMMREKHLSVSMLENITGLSYSAIMNYRKGNNTPSVYTALMLSKALGCELEELVL